MDTTGVSFISRKLIVSFVTAVLVAMVLSLFNLDLANYEQGNHFVGWTFIFFMYAGAVILVYGNIISIGFELLQRKYFVSLQVVIRSYSWTFWSISWHPLFGNTLRCFWFF